MSERRRIAFVFASNGPRNLDPLKYAVEDASRIGMSLASAACGFSVTTPSPGSDAFDVRRQLLKVTESCTPNDSLICYFSGHGILEKGNLFLLWDDTDVNHPISTAIPISEVLQALRYCKAKGKLLVLDCCHAGAVVNMVGMKDAAGTRITDTNVLADNHLVLMASDRFERAREVEGLRGSFLTTNICAALDDNLYDADIDLDGRLSVSDLMRWLEQRATEHNKRFPHLEVPTPYLFGQQKGQFFLTWEESDWLPCEFPSADGSTLVVLPAFVPSSLGERVLCLGKYPVLNEQYRGFLNRESLADRLGIWRGREPVGEWYIKNEWRGPFYPWQETDYSDPQQPVVCVSYFDAAAYCDWVLSLTGSSDTAPRPVNVRLPGAREWDFAAFGVTYPSRNPKSWLSRSRSIHHRANKPAPIDHTGARSNAWGLSDMFGNVWEWCRSEQRLEPVIRIASIGALPGSPRSIYLRGGSFLDDLRHVEPIINSGRLQDGIKTSHCDLGFRIAAEVYLDDLPETIRARLNAWPKTYFDDEELLVAHIEGGTTISGYDIRPRMPEE
jgi:hypothetical protein